MKRLLAALCLVLLLSIPGAAALSDWTVTKTPEENRDGYRMTLYFKHKTTGETFSFSFSLNAAITAQEIQYIAGDKIAEREEKATLTKNATFTAGPVTPLARPKP